MFVQVSCVKNWLVRGLVLFILGIPIFFSSDSVTFAQLPVGLQLVESSNERIVLDFNLPAYTQQERTINGATFTTLSANGLSQNNEAGKPQIPVQGTMLGIPANAQPTLKILTDDSKSELLAHPVIPAPTAHIAYDIKQVIPRYTDSIVQPDAATYSANTSYPATIAQMTPPSIWRSQRYVQIELHPFQYNPATRTLIVHQHLRVEITFTYPRGENAQTLGSARAEGSFESILSKSLLNYQASKNWRANPNTVPQIQIQSSVTAAVPWYRIAVNTDGIYKITCAQLATAGIPTATLDPRTLKIFKNGTQLAIYVAGQADGRCNTSDYLEFFGKAVQDKYSNTNIYWLTYTGALGKRMATQSGALSGGTAVSDFAETLHLEQDLVYRSYFPMIEDADHWFWNFLAPVYDMSTQNYPFELDHVANGQTTASIQLNLYAYSTNGHHTQVFINNNLIDDALWSGQSARTATISFSQSYLKNSANILQLKELSDVDPEDVVVVNHFNINYRGAFTTATDTRRFTQPTTGTWRYQITGFTNSSILVYDISDPFNVGRVTGSTISQVGTRYTLKFTRPQTTPREYLALTRAKRLTPLSITAAPSANLRDLTNSADYIIISYTGFLSNIQPLANQRAAQGLRVKVVDVQNVYDEFSDGVMTPRAIRDFLAYTYTNWQLPAPAYVLLVGATNFDTKGNCLAPGTCLGVDTPPNSNFIPPYLRMVDPWMGETVSDNRLVSFHDNDSQPNTLPNMAIGRLPARTGAEVDAMVAKILVNEQNPPLGAWRDTLTFVADNPDSAGNFWNLSDNVAGNTQYVPSPFTANRIYYPQSPYTTSAQARSGIVSAINNGSLIVNYVGHGWIQGWGKDEIFGIDQASTLTNSNRMPVMLEMTCYTGYFIYPGLPSLAEANVRLAGNGALASWSASGLGIAEGHDYLNQGFFDAVMQHDVLRIGDAAVLGKTNLWQNSGGTHHDLIDTFNLLGDPASRLAIGTIPTPTATPTPTASPNPNLLTPRVWQPLILR